MKPRETQAKTSMHLYICGYIYVYIIYTGAPGGLYGDAPRGGMPREGLKRNERKHTRTHIRRKVPIYLNSPTTSYTQKLDMPHKQKNKSRQERHV